MSDTPLEDLTVATKETAKSWHRSIYDPGAWLTNADKLAELMCERRAKIEGRTLPNRFWDDLRWCDDFRHQRILAISLMKRLDPRGTGSGMNAICRALGSKKGRESYSLAAPFLLPLIEKAYVDFRPPGH
jgi:hypothetical protein